MFRNRKLTDDNHQKLGREVEKLLFDDYIHIIGSTRRQIGGSFLRGFFTGLGGVVGATLGVAVLLAVLHYLGGAPVIGHYLRDVADSISQGRN